MHIRCPACRATFSLEVAVQEAEVDRFVATIAGQPRALLEYLSLWRPARSRLTWARAAKLAEEAVALARAVDADSSRFEAALMNTVSGIRAKVADGQGQLPITSHGYLRKVLAARPVATEEATATEGGIDYAELRRRSEEQAEAAARRRLQQGRD